MSRFLVSTAAAFLLGLPAVFGQQPAPHPAFASRETFLAELAGKKWETSFTTYPRVRFNADTIDIVDDDGKVSRSLVKVSQPEPGVVRVEYSSGQFALFIFADDMESFVLASMKDLSQFKVEEGAAKIPLAGTDAPLTISFTDNPFWKQARLHVDKMEILDGSGNAFATNRAFAYSTRVQGVALPENQVGAVILSRQTPGTGWYVSGRHLGTGVRTDKYGYFRPFRRTQLTDFHLRSAHFNYALLSAGKDQVAYGQERYAQTLVGSAFGETSEKVAYCLNEMATLRRNARSYAHAAVLHGEALALAKTTLSANKPVLLEFSTDLAVSQNDAGDPAAAKKTLAEAYPLLPPPSPAGDIRPTFLFYDTLAFAEFGLRNYPAAAQQFIDNSKRAAERKVNGSVVDSLLNLIPCQLAQNQAGLAESTLNQAMAVQKERQAANRDGYFDTWRLAFACVALGKNKEALQWARLNNQRKNYVSYEEYGRLVSLFHGDDPAAAQALAKSFVGRFSNIQEDITVRDDIDPITVKLTLAIADPTPANVAALEQVWAAQMDSLRNRPLRNYIFARVMVLTLAKLKSGR
ncbi:MAG: hypothetical protein ACO1TE_12945 [Prosthecobacter sp.]